MRRFLCLLCCLFFLFAPGTIAAEEKPPVALTFEGDFSALELRELLAGLDRRRARATFFLDAAAMEQNPGLGAQISGRGHEVGILVSCHRDGALLSRRDIAGQFDAVQSCLPKGSRLRFWRTRDRCTDAARQVAGALHLSPGSWTLDPAAGGNSSARSTGFMGRVRSGDVIRISGCTVPAALNMVELLQQKFTLVTLAELARVPVARQ